tara:strand:+ start:134 stop:379 length:246 start_codon:yes stop_codon:yes gene_type:complete
MSWKQFPTYMDIFNYHDIRMESAGIIHLTENVDKMLADIAQNAIVTGTTLPSGLKIPKKGTWVISKHMVIKKRHKTKNVPE